MGLFRHLAASVDSGRLRGDVALLVNSVEGAPTGSQPPAARTEYLTLDAASLGADGVDEAVCEALLQRDIDLVVVDDGLATIGKRTLEAYSGRIVSTALVPPQSSEQVSMLDEGTFEEALNAELRTIAVTVRVSESGFETHLARAATYVSVKPDDTAATLERRVHAAAQELVVQALARLADEVDTR